MGKFPIKLFFSEMQGLGLKIYPSELPSCWSLMGGRDLGSLCPWVVDGLWGPGEAGGLPVGGSLVLGLDGGDAGDRLRETE